MRILLTESVRKFTSHTARYLVVLHLISGCAAPAGHQAGEDLPLPETELDEGAFQEAYCREYGCPELDPARADTDGVSLREWLTVDAKGQITCGTEMLYEGSATVEEVVGMFTTNWSAWWPDSRVHPGEQRTFEQYRFRFNPLVRFGIAPTTVNVLIETAQSDEGLLPVKLTGDFEGSAWIEVEQVNEGRGLRIVSRWSNVKAKGVFAIRPQFFAWLHLRREAAGLRGLASKLREHERAR